MATIKSFTDISQSKTLSTILPLESADMFMFNNVGESGKVDGTNTSVIFKEYFNPLAKAPEILPCWSLAALLNVLPEGYSSILTKSFNGKDYYCKLDGKPIEIMADNPVDACVEMIEKLNELKML